MALNGLETRKPCCMVEGVRRGFRDKISQLPDEIIVQILSSIPTKDVVKTSILSKRWRSLWTSVDAVFITDFDLNSPWAPDEKKAGFMNFVDNVLNQVVFVRKLGLNFTNLRHSSRFKQWINIVNSKLDVYGALDELDLNFRRGQIVELPPHIFTNKKLVILKLSYNAAIDFPSSSREAWLPSLKVFHFISLESLDVSFVEYILAVCPVLEELLLEGYVDNKLKKERLCVKSSLLKSLTLCCYGDIFNIEIEAPNLEELDVLFSENSRIVILNTNLAFLKRLKYEIFGAWLHHSDRTTIDFFENAVREFLRKTSNIKYLFVSSDTIKYSCFLKVLPMFKTLMHLKLDIDICYLSFLYSLLKIAPNLVSFVLHSNDGSRWSHMEQFRTTDNNGLMLEFLETVEFTAFRGSDQEMDLVTYFLKIAPVLKKMTILFRFGDVAARLHSRIVELPKASVACEVILQ